MLEVDVYRFDVWLERSSVAFVGSPKVTQSVTEGDPIGHRRWPKPDVKATKAKVKQTWTMFKDKQLKEGSKLLMQNKDCLYYQQSW